VQGTEKWRTYERIVRGQLKVKKIERRVRKEKGLVRMGGF